MPIDKDKLLQMSKDDKERKTKGLIRPMKITATKDDNNVMTELINTLDDTKDNLSVNVVNKVIPFIFWNNIWNEYGVFGTNTAKANYWRYTSGQMVYVDFGCGNIKTELSFPHPAILLYNFAQTAIVIPMTTDDKKTPFDAELEDVIIKVKGSKDSINNDSIINMHQPKAIHKERIINKINYNVKNYIIDDDEIKRLNSRINIEAFKANMSLWECIQLKYTLMFNRELFNQQTKLLNERNQLIQHINDIEEMLNQFEEENSDAIRSIKLKIENTKKAIDI